MGFHALKDAHAFKALSEWLDKDSSWAFLYIAGLRQEIKLLVDPLRIEMNVSPRYIGIEIGQAAGDDIPAGGQFV